MTAEVFDAAQWQSVLNGEPALVTARQLAELLALDDESEIHDLARRGLVVQVGTLFDAKLSTQRYCRHLEWIARKPLPFA